MRADLLDPPAQWGEAFSLVIEIITVQALPRKFRAEAIANVSAMVAPGGTLLVIAAVQDELEESAQGPPWPLTRSEVETFAIDDLRPVRIEDAAYPEQPTEHRWRAEFARPRR